MSVAQQTLIASALERKLSKEIITPSLVNRNYEGEITGPEDSVKILTPTAATVQDYDGGFINIQTNVDGTSAKLDMDHSKAFAFILKATENLQRYVSEFSNESFDEILRLAEARVLAEADAAKAGNMTAGDVTYISGTDDVEEKLADAAQSMDASGVPAQGRYVVVDSQTARDISDKVAARNTLRGDAADRTGFVAMYRGFNVFQTADDRFTEDTGSKFGMYGHARYLTYGDAVVAVEVDSPVQGSPGSTLIQGAHVAGAKVTQSDAFGRFIME